MPSFLSPGPASAILILIAALIAGCGGSAVDSPSPSLPEVPPEFPGSAGAIAWQETTAVPSELREGHVAFADLEELQREIVRYLVSAGERGAQVSVGLLAQTGDDEAAAYGFVSGAADDSIAGVEYRFTLRRSVDGWFVAAMEQRTHCRRGVSGDLCV